MPTHICVSLYVCVYVCVRVSWKEGEFGPCSASCGGGVQVRELSCVQTRGQEQVEVPASLCPQDSVPVAVGTCAAQPCPAR